MPEAGTDDSGADAILGLASFFQDEDPASAVKGLGFGDAAMARRTIELAHQPGKAHRRNKMIEAVLDNALRARQTDGTAAAVEVFRGWLAREGAAEAEVDGTAVEEAEKQELDLRQSQANSRALSRCANQTEFLRFAAEDRADGLRRLQEATQGKRGASFALPMASFVALFGAPGDHGYGRHRCDSAMIGGLAAFRCDCQSKGPHSVVVEGAGEVEALLGPQKDGKPVERLTIGWQWGVADAGGIAEMLISLEPAQTNLEDAVAFAAEEQAAREAQAEKAKALAAASLDDPIGISDSDEEPPTKRQCT